MPHEDQKPLSEDDPRLLFMPIEIATRPPSGIIEHIKDSWWVAHPEKGIVWHYTGKYKSFETSSPQCNANKNIAIRFCEPYPWATILFLPSVFRRINPQDYA
jgi:hypothetical protein